MFILYMNLVPQIKLQNFIKNLNDVNILDYNIINE